MKEYILENAYLADGWATDVHITISDLGDISKINPGSTKKNVPVLSGFAIPGIPNTHSHAFQRALSGMAEFSSSQQDNFWGWREMMYSLSSQISPEALYRIAAQLYMEMLKAGYTTVAEFHYLHHQADGSHYDMRSEMALAILQAARVSD
ncbi:MAG: formimidoylglutamate deiminase [Gammaproteobacteria bacterium]|jgi:formimidoylglutamate deiminase